MTPAAGTIADTAPLPGRGERVMLDGLPGGPWTTIVEHEHDGVLSLSPPRLGGRPVPLPLQRVFTLAYTLREMPCEVDALLVSGPAADQEGSYVARTTGTTRRIQRRGAVRVGVNLIVRAHLGDDIDGQAIGAITENLSAGGALLRLASPMSIGSPMHVAVHCGGSVGELEVTATTVRCDRLEDGGERPWRIAITFADLTVVQEDGLVRFIFERQRELRAREAGRS